MPSNYPNALDSFATNHLDGEVIDNDTDNNQADAINKIEAELGVNPSNTFTTVAARLNAIELNGPLSGKGFINHGSNANALRPTGFASIEWFGSVAPNNAANGDTWVNTA